MSFAVDETIPPPKDFNAFNQDVVLYVPEMGYGYLAMQDINSWMQTAVKASINYGAQFGASIIIFILLLILTKDDKRRSPIFVFNCIGIALNGIKNLLQAFFYTTPFWNLYSVVVGDFSPVTNGPIAQGVVVSIFAFLVYICIIVSLNLQVNVMLATSSSSRKRITITSISFFLAFLTLTFRFALTVINCRSIVAKADQSEWQWLTMTCNILLTITICYTSSVFATKLFLAIRQRRVLNMTSFGPMQILFIMALQTLCIPALFSILQHVTEVPQFQTLVLTITMICLPLSSMWAAADSDEPRSSAARKGSSFFFKGWSNNTSRSDSGQSATRVGSDACQRQPSHSNLMFVPMTPSILEEGRPVPGSIVKAHGRDESIH